MNSRIDKLISFLKEIEKFKLIQRRAYVSDLTRRESDAEHVWHLAMFILLFKKELPKNLDFDKVFKMVLIHDLVEIEAGDTMFFDRKAKKTQKEREDKAAKNLFSKLPKDLHDDFLNTFNEFEQGKTKEAKIVRSFDSLQAILQNICCKGLPWKEHNVKGRTLDGMVRKRMIHSDITLEIYNRLFKEVKEKKLV